MLKVILSEWSTYVYLAWVLVIAIAMLLQRKAPRGSVQAAGGSLPERYDSPTPRPSDQATAVTADRSIRVSRHQ